ncbi:MAG TPA: DUF2231 domain-containing protein [Terriglobia bacterium]|nr:DUF2231 domain-containing protein [Terriglobia bacterium]
MSFFGIPVHFLLVHFPIGLALTAAFVDCRGRLSRTADRYDTGYRLTMGAAAGAALAAVTGMQLLGGRTGNPSAAMHAAAGLIVTVSLVVLAAIRYSARARQTDMDEPLPILWLALELFAAAAVIAAAITGHRFALSL